MIDYWIYGLMWVGFCLSCRYDTLRIRWWVVLLKAGRVIVGCIFWRWIARYFGIESLGLLIAGWVFELRSKRVGRWITVAVHMIWMGC